MLVRSFLFLLAICSVGSQALAHADESKPVTEAVFDINSLVKLIVNHNPNLQVSQRSLEMASAGVSSASALANPRLEWSGGRNQALPGSGSTGSLNGLAISQFIENPLQRSARIEAALSVERGSLQFVAATQNELVAQIRARAFEYLLRKEEVLAATDALSLLGQIRDRVRLRVQTGETGKYELIKADAEIINARQREQTAKLQVDQAALTLNRLAAGKLPARWTLNASLTDMMELPLLDTVEQTALKNNPELRVLQAELDRTYSRVDEVAASRWPGLELRYGQQREPDMHQNVFSISLQVPLLDQRNGPRGEAIADRERARTRLEGRRAELMQQLAMAWKSVEIARVRIDALAEGAMREAESALKVAEAAYRFGERGILDVLDAQRVLRAVRADLLQARYQLQTSTIELDFLAGRYVSINN